jgi:hypothetical protein
LSECRHAARPWASNTRSGRRCTGSPSRWCRARYVSLAPAIWLYATNTILFALVAIRMNTLARADHGRGSLLEDRLGLIVLIVASVLSIVASLLVPKWAMLVYLVNFVDGPLRWLLKGKAGRSRKA